MDSYRQDMYLPEIPGFTSHLRHVFELKTCQDQEDIPSEVGTLW